MKKLFVFVSLSITSILFSINALAGANQIYSNGPLITQSGTGVDGNDESVLENNTLSMNSYGTAHQAANNLRVSDDFIVSDNGWQIDSINLYAYQTNETASTITAVNLRIWDGIPEQPGSNVVFGDTSTNLLNSTFFSGILRVDEDNQGIDNIRQIAISEISIDTFFPTGTYWIDWQAEGSGGSGPFVPHITIPGQNTTGNALISIDNGLSYSILLDNGSLTQQGLPFIINGSIVSGLPAQAVPGLHLFSQLLLIMLIAIYMYKFYDKKLD